MNLNLKPVFCDLSEVPIQTTDAAMLQTPFTSKHFNKLFFTSLVVLYCEVFIYFVAIMQCSWPALDRQLEQKNGPHMNTEPLKMMLLADTHLLGPVKGHWFDKLRR